MSTFISSNQNREGYKGQNHAREMIQSCSSTPDSGREGAARCCLVYSPTSLVLLQEDCHLQKYNSSRRRPAGGCKTGVGSSVYSVIKGESESKVIEIHLVCGSVRLFRIFPKKWNMAEYTRDKPTTTKKKALHTQISDEGISVMWSRENTLI